MSLKSQHSHSACVSILSQGNEKARPWGEHATGTDGFGKRVKQGWGGFGFGFGTKNEDTQRGARGVGKPLTLNP